MKFSNSKELWNYIEKNAETIQNAMAKDEEEYGEEIYGMLIDLAIQVENYECQLDDINKKKSDLKSNIAYWSIKYQVQRWRDEALRDCTDIINKYLEGVA